VVNSNKEDKEMDKEQQIKWIEEEIRKSKGKYKVITCPYLVDSKCSIYDKRFSCCRNFPQKQGYCSDADCDLGNGHCCDNCEENCCENILVPKNSIVDKAFIGKLMDIDCDTCRRLFK
jgi:hypothetical protein